MDITGHVFDKEDSDESDYEIEHDGSIQSKTRESEDVNSDKEEVEEHQNVQNKTNERPRQYFQQPQWVRSGEYELKDIFKYINLGNQLHYKKYYQKLHHVE